MIPDTFHYIAWRNTATYLQYSGMTGGLPVNSDDRLWKTEGAPFVLSLFDAGTTRNYAVSDADAQALIDRIRAHCGDRPSGTGMPSRSVRPDGPAATAQVQIGNEHLPFNDAGLLREWFDALAEKCGAPLTEPELYHYTHPAPAAVEGEPRVVKMVEQAVIPQQPPSLPVPPPDNCRSELLVDGDLAVLSVFRGRMHLEYVLPNALLPRVNAAAKEMLAHPADGYHQTWDADAWVKVAGRDEEFDVAPDEVLALFTELVKECGDPIPCSGEHYFYKVYPEAVRRALAGAWDCPKCGRPRNTGNYCEICGAALTDIHAGTARCVPKPRADAPWRCNACKTEGNIGSYCSCCGKPYEKPAFPPDGEIGYRRGRTIGGGSGFFSFVGMDGMMKAAAQAQPPAAQEAAAPDAWTCSCGQQNTGKFCTECGSPSPVWTCACGHRNTGKFCSECGAPRP